MMRTFLSALLALVVLCSASLGAATLAGVTLADSVNVAGKTLVLNGIGLRTRLMFKVYVAGLYVERKSNDGKALAGADAPKRIVLHFVRSVSADQIREAIVDGFDAQSKQSLKADIDKFGNALTPFKDGDELVITYVPGTGTQVAIRNSDVVTIPGFPFAKALFMIWLGDAPPSTDLQNGLLGR